MRGRDRPFPHQIRKALFRKAASPAQRLSVLAKIAGLLPTHTRRSEESQARQQFSTPLPLGLAALTAAGIGPDDVVLEPSAGTGLLAILAQVAGGFPILNELADTRADLLSCLFPAYAVTRFDAAQIDDHLDAGAMPSVVLMNPPFSAMAHVSGRMADATYRHIASALARLAPGGRLVAITGANFAPDAPDWRDAFVRLQERGRVVFTAAIDGSVYAGHGTTFPTRLTVIDKIAAEDAMVFPLPLAPRPISPLCSAGSRPMFHRACRSRCRRWQCLPPQRRCAAISRARLRRGQRPSRSPIPQALNSPMRPSIGRRLKAPI